MIAAEKWKFRWLFINFLRKEISDRYIGSISGIFWLLINPLALLAIYGFVFAVIFRVNVPELKGRAFIEFVALGLWPWLAFQEGVQRGTASIQNAAGLIKKVSFPHELIVYGSVASTYLVHVAGFLIVLVVMGLSGKEIHFAALPVAMLFLLFQMMFTCGLVLLSSALQVFVRDVEHVLSPLLMIWFYATPVLYPASLVPEQIRSVMALNPMAMFIGNVRDALLHGVVSVTWQTVALAVGSIALFALGRLMFRRLSPHFEDFI